VGFRVAQGWPVMAGDVKGEQRAVRAVESLVANHTLIVGQSRSGKTNAARVLIEQILMWTEARVVILDPNADFTELSQTDDKEFERSWASVAQSVRVAAQASGAWGIKWDRLSLPEMAAFLGVTAKQEFAEYRHLRRHREFQEKSSEGLGTLESFMRSQYFQIAGGEELERYQLLLQQLSELKVWAERNREDLDSLLGKENRAVIIDLSIDDEEVRTITAARTLEVLWRLAEERRKEFVEKKITVWPGTLVVIDEAHLFAPPETEDETPRKRLVRERIARFADQGKKFNLHLMLVSQQPGKLHEQVLSECNNRVILRMSERRSLEVLERIYGGLKGRYDGALTFETGEALLEGDLLCDEVPPPAVPRGIRFLKASTREGGGTPKKDWAQPKSM
jgi:DNA helicase HerA-like ATPase